MSVVVMMLMPYVVASAAAAFVIGVYALWVRYN